MIPEMSLSHQLLWSIPNRVLNILISPWGRGKLARPPGATDDLPSWEGMDIPLFFAFMFLVYLSLPALLRYVLGHVTPMLLILQVSQQDEAVPEKSERVIKQRASFRNVGDSFRLIYRAQGLYTFTRALAIGSIYLLANGTITGTLQWILFRHELLKPLAYACSSAILCELHLVFTCATVSAQRIPFRSLGRKSCQNRWKHLAIPALLYGLLQALMEQLYDFVAMAITRQEGETYTGIYAAAEVLAVIIMLAFRFLALLPTYITLTLAEAKLLLPEIETVIPSSTKERGLKIGELTGDRKPPSGLEAFTSVLKPLGTATYLQLIELHLKKCFAQIVLEVALTALILVASFVYPYEDEGIV